MALLPRLTFGASINYADTVAPTLTSASIPAAGTSLSIVLSKAVRVGTGGNGGFTIAMSGGAVTLTYASGSGSTTLVYTTSRTVNSGETCSDFDYTQPGNGVESLYTGIDLATFTNQQASVTNNSTVSGAVTLYDSFSRSSSTNLGSDWTEAEGDLEIILNDRLSHISTATVCRAAHNTSLGTETQYGKFTVLSVDGAAWLVFRYVDASTAHYLVGLSNFSGNAEWSTYGGGGASNQTSSLSFAANDTFAAVVTGTGTSTEVRIWKNATGNTPDAGGATWGSASPTLTFTNNPSVEANTGLKVGMGMYGNSANHMRINEWRAGDVT